MVRATRRTDPLDEALAACAALQVDADADPLAYMRWMVPQDKFLRLPGRAKAYRAGNQALGKSTVGLAEVLMHCRGSHPYRAVKPPPVAWVICSLNQTQSLAIQAKFHALVGAEELAPGSKWNPKTGYGANKPLTMFANGSTIRWVTDDQGPRAVAGSTLDGVLVDEPCSPEMLRELKKRLLRRRGTLLLTFTPINGPTEHIREEIESGRIAEIHAPLTEDNLRHADDLSRVHLEDGTPCDQVWINSVWAETSALEAEIVNNGGWDRAVQGVYFHCFDPNRHVAQLALTASRQGRRGRLRWLVGIDYAAADREYGQCAVLVQALEIPRPVGGSEWWINVVDEAVASGTIDTEDFAGMVLGMLTRAGLRWDQLDGVHGDNPVTSRWETRSNDLMMQALALHLRIPKRALTPIIRNAKEGVRSDRALTEGCRWLFARLATGHVNIRPRCTHLSEAFKLWDFTADHPHKDILDALRYALRPAMFPRGITEGARVRIAA